MNFFSGAWGRGGGAGLSTGKEPVGANGAVSGEQEVRGRKKGQR